MVVHHQIAPCRILKTNCKVVLDIFVGLLKVHIDEMATVRSLFPGTTSLTFCQSGDVVHPDTRELSTVQSFAKVHAFAMNLSCGCQKTSDILVEKVFCQFGI